MSWTEEYWWWFVFINKTGFKYDWNKNLITSIFKTLNNELKDDDCSDNDNGRECDN